MASLNNISDRIDPDTKDATTAFTDAAPCVTHTFDEDISLHAATSDDSNDSITFNEREARFFTRTPDLPAPANKVHRSERSTTKTSGISALRFLFLDVPLAIIFVCFLLSCCLQNLYETYFTPLMKATEWTEERTNSEFTYYYRDCDETDLSTTDGADLVLPMDVDPQEANKHMMIHGQSVYRNVVSQETAANLREYVLRRNAALTKDEAIWLISQKNRWSFLMAPSDDPTIAAFLKEVATHPTWRPVMDAIMGPEPAIVELTAITSAYGAGDQHWHQDSRSSASSTNHARSFVPMYSLFVALQNTTAAMGATGICPGLHFCANFDMQGTCNDHGFKFSNSQMTKTQPENEVWQAGDGLLMNLASWHRGPAHEEPAMGSERVMLILTLSPRPRPSDKTGFDRRRISFGSSYSLRWDTWDFTLADAQEPEKYMMGLNKYRRLARLSSKGQKYGWDYLSEMACRVSSEESGFSDHDLEKTLERIRRTLVGRLVVGGNEYTKWVPFLEETVNRIVLGFGFASLAGLVLYMVVSVCLDKSTRLGQRLRRSVTRVAFSYTFSLVTIYMLFSLYTSCPSIAYARSGKLEESPFDEQFEMVPSLPSKSQPHGPTTKPVKSDVLFGTRYGDKELLTHHHEFLDYHPGNSLWGKLVGERVEDYAALERASPALRGDFISDLVNKVEHGRFLLQSRNGDWMAMDDAFGLEETRRALIAGVDIVKKKAYAHLKDSAAQQVYGICFEWKTVMKQVYTPLLLHDLEKLLFEEDVMPTYAVVRKQQVPAKDTTLAWLRAASHIRVKPSFSNKSQVAIPTYAIGDSVMADYQNEGEFYPAVIKHVHDKWNEYDLHYPDGSIEERVSESAIRPYYTTFTAGDIVECEFADVGILQGVVQRVTPVGMMRVLWEVGKIRSILFTQARKVA